MIVWRGKTNLTVPSPFSFWFQHRFFVRSLAQFGFPPVCRKLVQLGQRRCFLMSWLQCRIHAKMSSAWTTTRMRMQQEQTLTCIRFWSLPWSPTMDNYHLYNPKRHSCKIQLWLQSNLFNFKEELYWNGFLWFQWIYRLILK